ncbi:MAG: acylneuraminate cytidylyltransferase family protein [Bdellovibrionota bacterium]
MNNKSKVLAIIPARGGSKRIIKKNLAKVGQLSLVEMSMKEAIESQIFSKIILSSDDSEILEQARSYPEVEALQRSGDLASDTASSVDVVCSILEQFRGQFDYICLLQPTSPFRTFQHIKEAFFQLKEGGCSTLVSVKPVLTNPFHVVVKKGAAVEPLIDPKIFNFRTQQTPEIFSLNGCIYFAKSDYFEENKSFLGNNTGVYLMSEPDSLDIDTQEDLEMARKIFYNR